MTKTYKIPTYDLPTLDSHMERLNRRAKRLNVEPVAYKVVSKEVKKSTNEFTGITTATEFSVIEFLPQFVRVGGWTFVGTITYLPCDDGTSAAMFLNATTIPVPREVWEGVKPTRCDYCQTNRDINDTFVLCNQSGHYKIVGRNCLADFLGHDAAAFIASIETNCGLLHFIEEMEEMGRGYKAKDVWPLETFLAYSEAMIRTYGWLGRGKARDTNQEGMATADLVADYLTSKERSEQFKNFKVEDIDKERAKAAMEWLETVDDNSDYIANCKIILKAGLVTLRVVGLACSIMFGYQNALNRESERLNKASSEFVGAVGERLNFAVKVASQFNFSTQFGVTTCYEFVTSEGNILKYFSTRDLKLKNGQDIVIKARIKNHKVNKGVKETIITRGTVC